jgi:hypothetical protein
MADEWIVDNESCFVLSAVYRYNRLTTSSIPATLSNCTALEQFNVENNMVSNLPDGLLSSLENLTQISLSRNQFTSFPAGGPAQFINTVVSGPLKKSMCPYSRNRHCLPFSSINVTSSIRPPKSLSTALRCQAEGEKCFKDYYSKIKRERWGFRFSKLTGSIKTPLELLDPLW